MDARAQIEIQAIKPPNGSIATICNIRPIKTWSKGNKAQWEILLKSVRNVKNVVFGFFFKGSEVELSPINGVQLRISERAT